MPRFLAFLTSVALGLGLVACSGSDEPPSAAPSARVTDDYLVGRPQNRAGIGDVEAVFDRYASSRAGLIATYREQPWFKDGLSRDEALFAERGLSFVARYDGPRSATVSDETIRRKLYLYDRVKLRSGEVELLLIYEPGQDAEREMALVKAVIPVLEQLVAVEFPEKVLTVVNGDFEINDFNDGQFIRITRGSIGSGFVLAHELAHTYWSMASSWFNEGMADIYAVLAIEALEANPPAGWNRLSADLDAHYRSRQASVSSGRFPDLTLPRRFASDGLYEAADVFLLDIRRLIGHHSFLAAARDIYLTSDFGRYTLREKRLQDAFLARAPESAREGVSALFNRMIWGDNGERYQELQELEGR